MTKERLERIKENVNTRCSIAITTRIGLTAPDKEEVELIEEIEKLNNIIDKKEQFLVDNIKRLEREVVKRDNIINELEKHLEKEISTGRSEDNIWLMGCYDEDREILDKLQELKGSDK